MCIGVSPPLALLQWAGGTLAMTEISQLRTTEFNVFRPIFRYFSRLNITKLRQVKPEGEKSRLTKTSHKLIN